MNPLIIFSFFVGISLPSLANEKGVERQDHGGDKPDIHLRTERGENYYLSVNYDELARLVKTKYEFMAFHHQLMTVRSEIGRDLDQILNITTNPVDMKNKKWSDEELEKIISHSLKKETN